MEAQMASLCSSVGAFRASRLAADPELSAEVLLESGEILQISVRRLATARLLVVFARDSSTVSVLAHDLRNALFGLTAMLEALPGGPPELSEHIRILLAQAGRVQRAAEKLILFTQAVLPGPPRTPDSRQD